MIVVRDVFQLHFGAAREAIALWQEGLEFQRRDDAPRDTRLMTDLTGNYYTLALESTYDNLASYETGMQKLMSDPTWKAWYARFTPLVQSGRREIYTVVGSAVPGLATGAGREAMANR